MSPTVNDRPRQRDCQRRNSRFVAYREGLGSLATDHQMMVRTRMSGEADGGCPVTEAPGARRKRHHEIITTASQDFLDKPDQVHALNRDLFCSLAANAIPALEGKIAEKNNIGEYLANSPIEKRLLIARGQHQALRSALTHLVFMELAESVLPLLERDEALLLSAQEICGGGTYVCGVIKTPYLGAYHQFMLCGVRWIQQPALRFIELLRRPGHPYHQLFVATYEAQSVVRGQRLEQQRRRPHHTYQGIIRDPENFQSYQPLFIANLEDVMITLVAAQKAYLARANKKNGNCPRPEMIARLVLTNLETFSLPARMKREAALKKLSHPAIRYANQPMKDNPFAQMPSIFVVVGDLPQLKLDLAPEFTYLKSVSQSFCAGVIAHRSGGRRGQEVAERLLSVAGVPSGRPPDNPDYGKIDPITALVIIGVHIAKDTIFRESPSWSRL